MVGKRVKSLNYDEMLPVLYGYSEPASVSVALLLPLS